LAATSQPSTRKTRSTLDPANGLAFNARKSHPHRDRRLCTPAFEKAAVAAELDPFYTNKYSPSYPFRHCAITQVEWSKALRPIYAWLRGGGADARHRELVGLGACRGYQIGQRAVIIAVAAPAWFRGCHKEFAMEQILINLVAGALGGVGAGKSSPTFDLGTIGNVISGLVGGGLLGQGITLLLPSIMAAAQSGDLSITGIISQAVAGGAGGAILTAVIGAIKNRAIA
jgi:hypothetical protein